MADHLSILAENARNRVRRGYYDNPMQVDRPRHSLVETIRKTSRTPVITEIKYASPSSGRIREYESPTAIAKAMLEGGASGLSVLTDPDDFKGGLEILADVASQMSAPVLMKDVLVSPKQLEAGSSAGADAVVLISEIFSAGLATVKLDRMIDEARRLGMEVLVEANDSREFNLIQKCKSDLYGINNRNLSTFQIELATTERILSRIAPTDRPVVSESGIESAADIRRLRKAGADAFLVGSSIMRSSDIQGKVRELVHS
jgi:indole-3-glycerol phosphate synthase